MVKNTRRDFLKAVGVTALSTTLTGCLSSRNSFSCKNRPRPNILFIFTDDHAVQSIGAYGSRINKTPNIDRIAAEGAVFANNFCANSICAPSRATVLTGKHSHINGVINNGVRFKSEQPTFPAMLQQAGYRTAMVGKWHLKNKPHGFDYWEILPDQGSYYNPVFITEQGRKRYEGYVTDITTDRALDWLKQKAGDQDKPFLLMCQHKAPHRNWSPGPNHLYMYDDVEIPEPPTLFDDYSNRSKPLKENEMMIAKHMMYDYDLKVPGLGIKDSLGRNFRNGEYARMTPAQKKQWDAAYKPRNEKFIKSNLKGKDLVRWKYQRYIKDYLRCIASVDDNIGRMLDYLDEAGLADNTMVVYSSDQGFYLGEHGWYDKRWMYEESFRMPLIMRYPGAVKKGIRVKALTQNIDFAPTFLDAAKVPIPEDIQGVSLKPLWRGKQPDNWRDAIYYHYYERGEHHVPRHEGVRTQRYKLISYYDSNEWDLFDLKNDPQELHSLYSDPQYKKIVNAMKEKLKELKTKYKVQ